MTDLAALADETPEPGEQLFLPRPKHGWVCFFCGEVLMTPGAAQDHFGAEPFAEAACRIKLGEERGLVMALRQAEEELARYRAEDSDKDRELAAMACNAGEKIRRAEEEGYAKALADIEAGKVEPDHAARIVAALRASRPEPAADAVETAATRVADATLCQWGKPGDCGREDNPCLCEAAAKAALSALARPEADEGAVRKADEIFDDITRGGPTVDAVMREDWATVAEWMRQRAEDGLAVTRAALAAWIKGEAVQPAPAPRPALDGILTIRRDASIIYQGKDATAALTAYGPHAKELADDAVKLAEFRVQNFGALEAMLARATGKRAEFLQAEIAGVQP